jgi:hypothetical protein
MNDEKIKAFTDEIRAICERHRLGIVGTCEGEGIYGEIMIFDLDDPSTWGDPGVMEKVYNFDTRYLKPA